MTNFQDLVAKVKNLVALAPVLGAISRPDSQTIDCLRHCFLYPVCVGMYIELYGNLASEQGRGGGLRGLTVTSSIYQMQAFEHTDDVFGCFKIKLQKY